MEQSGSMRVGPAYNIGSVGLFLALHFGALFLLLVSFIFIYGQTESSIAFLVLGMIAGLIALIYFYVLLYQVWRYIIEESRRHDLRPSIDSPGKAVGFCFIPIYNIYWIFMAYGKLPNDFNALSRIKNNNLINQMVNYSKDLMFADHQQYVS